MISSFVSKPLCFWKIPNNRLRRGGQVGHVRRHIKCQVEVAEVEVPKEATQNSIKSEKKTKKRYEEPPELSRINDKFRAAETTADWLESFKEEANVLIDDNVSVAADQLGKLANQFKRYGKDGPPQLSDQQKSEFLECYSVLIEKIEDLVPEFQSRTIKNCVRALHNGNLILEIEKKFENFQPVMQKMIKRAVEILDEFYVTELVKILYVISCDMEQYKNEFEILFKKAQQFKFRKFGKFTAQDMTYVLVNSKCSDINYINAFLDDMVRKYFRQYNSILSGNLARTSTQLRVKNTNIIESIKQFMDKNKKFNGMVLPEFAELIATFVQDQTEKNSMIDQMSSVIEEHGASFWTQDLVRILYCFAAMKAPVEKINQINNLLIQKLENKFDSLTSEQLRNLRWVQIFCESQNQQIDYPEELVYLCKNEQKQFIQNQIEQIKNDQFVNEVYEKVKGSYPAAECGAEISDGDLFISIFLENGDKKFAIEPLSEDKFVLSENQSENQLLGIKQSQLDVISSKGFQVLPVLELQWVDNVVYQDEVINSLQ